MMLFIVLVSTPLIRAVEVQVSFGGIITIVQDAGGQLPPDVVVGSSFQGLLSYDSGNTHDFDGSPWSGEYHFSDRQMAFSIGGFDVVTDTLSIGVVDYDFFGQRDALGFSDSSFNANGLTDLGMYVSLWDFSGTALDSDALPAFFTLEQFPDQRELELTDYEGTFSVFGEITALTVIPEPATGMIWAVLGAGVLMKRRRAA